MRAIQLVFLLCAIAAVVAQEEHVKSPLTKVITDYDVVEAFRVDQLRDDAHPVQYKHGHMQHVGERAYQPYASKLHLQFQAMNMTFRADMSLNVGLFTKEHRMNTYDGETDTLVSSTPAPLIAYAGETAEGGWVRVTMLDDGVFHGVFKLPDGDLVVVDPLTEHNENIPDEVKATLPSHARMVAYRMSDMIPDANIICPIKKEPLDMLDMFMQRTPSAKGSARKLLTRFSTCPTTRKGIVVGFAADCGLWRKLGGQTGIQTTLTSVYNSVNGLYEDQLNVHITLGPTKFYQTCGGVTWNEQPSTPSPSVRDCQYSIDDKLAIFSQWRGCCSNTAGTAADQTAGLWHLGTDCYGVIPGGGSVTVGLAWLAVLCRKNTLYCPGGTNCQYTSCTAPSSTNQCSSGAGVSSYTSNWWQVVGHETGHNFAGNHQTTGLMSYDKTTPQVFNDANGVEICAHIQATLSGSSNCFTDWAPVCGNGVKETGEACDDTSACCNQATCQLAAGATCSAASLQFGECCVSCQIAPSSTLCNSNQGFCTNGNCQYADCEQYSSLPFCGMSSTNPCLQRCTVSGNCYDRSQLTFSQDPGTAWWAPAGTLCKTSPVSYCDATANCVASQTTTYSWATGSFGTCSVTCGGGTQTRTVTCQASTGGTVADSYCTSTKPATSQACNTQACVTYSWNVGSYGTCSVTCGGGTQTRSVTCQASTGGTVADSYCTTTKPDTSQACNTQACPTYSWTTGTFGACSLDCGTGTQTRSVVCTISTGGTVADSYCTGTKPATSQNCNTQACVWVTGNYGTCSQSCGTGTQTRSVTCQSQASGGVVVLDSQCLQTKPATSQNCNTQACTTYSWYVGTFGACDQVCGGGTQTATVTCKDNLGNAVADSMCTSTKPSGSQACNTDACVWVTGTYGACSVSCGGGTQTRSVTCQSSTGAAAPSTRCLQTMPDTQQACNTQACPAYAWYVSGWSACSAPCNGGTHTRDVLCKDGNGQGTTVADTYCTDTKPVASEVCSAGLCYWNPSDATTGYGACSVSCGGGTQSRTVQCLAPGSTTAQDPTYCAATSKPAESQPCNTQACTSYYWQAGTWTACNPACGDGTQTRQVSCLMSPGGTLVADTNCDSPSRPADTQACSTNCTEPQWSAGPFGGCSVACGQGTAYRNVTCVDPSGAVVDPSLCDPTTMPASSGPCVGGQCTTSNSTCNCGSYSDYAPACPTDCQAPAVTQTRTRTCYLGSDVNAPCDATVYPTSDSKACERASCDAAAIQEKFTLNSAIASITTFDTSKGFMGVVYPITAILVLIIIFACCILAMCCFCKRRQNRRKKLYQDDWNVNTLDISIPDDINTSSTASTALIGTAYGGGGGGATGKQAIQVCAEPERYEAQWVFMKTMKDELDVQAGDIVMVTQKASDGWFTGTNERTGFTGYIPGNYLKVAPKPIAAPSAVPKPFQRPVSAPRPAPAPKPSQYDSQYSSYADDRSSTNSMRPAPAPKPKGMSRY